MRAWFGSLGSKVEGSNGTFVFSFLPISSSLMDTPFHKGIVLYMTRAEQFFLLVEMPVVVVLPIPKLSSCRLQFGALR